MARRKRTTPKATAFSAEILGFSELQQNISQFNNREIRKIDRKAMTQGMTVIRKAIRSEIPSHMKSIKKGIGSRFRKNRRKGVREAKVGSGVGQKRAKQVPHSHLILMGTVERFQKTRGNKFVGRVKALPAVKVGFEKSKAEAFDKMENAIQQGIEKAFDEKDKANW